MKTDSKVILSPNNLNVNQALVAQYTEVEFKYLDSIAATNGLTSDLIKRGAKLKRYGIANTDSEGKLVLQW